LERQWWGDELPELPLAFLWRFWRPAIRFQSFVSRILEKMTMLPLDKNGL
jgi:hypothetical protein